MNSDYMDIGPQGPNEFLAGPSNVPQTDLTIVDSKRHRTVFNQDRLDQAFPASFDEDSNGSPNSISAGLENQACRLP